MEYSWNELRPIPLLQWTRPVIAMILHTDSNDFVQLVEEEDERLFRRINNNATHVLRGLLPPPSMATQQYSLRRRPHDRQMPDHTGHLADKNFLIRLL